ncbi:hypothetical protein FAES_3628 [Fibrella aestuarina BUZ 2]|uniref:Uncharacterized protein n=1 Tax=Fibrella aestuarina BUZ 2 TaxID=1166018 RepID=I0KBY2_9BACT|nr:hypothetical protein [Fibrella aestuarina]CCH01635.1 hypothetical protein FAES_3628 [Fibrella aestuarina BUZ 2]
MSVTLLTPPDLFALTQGGRMEATFSADGRLISTGTKAINKIAFGGTPLVEGQHIVLRWGSQLVELIVRTTPVEPYEIPAGDVSDAHLTAIIAILKDYYPLREAFTNFRIHVDTEGFLRFRGIRFDARQPGTAYMLVAGQQGNVLTLQPLAGVNPTYRDLYSVYVEVWMQTPGGSTNPDDFVRVTEQRLDVDAAGLASIDVGEVLHPLLDVDWPTWNVPALERSKNSGRAYFLAFSEAWGNPMRPGCMQRTEPFWAYLGGADYRRRADGGFSLTGRLVGATAGADRALRLGTDGARYLAPDATEYLTFLNTRVFLASVRLDCTLTFDDNSTATFTNLLAPSAWARGEKLTLPVGPLQLGLLAKVPAGRYLREYSVRLYSGSSPISQAYRYVLDYARRPWSRPFAYLNSLGAVATLTGWGKGASEWNRFGELAERALPADYALQEGEYSEYDVALQQSVEVVTGFRTKADLRGWFDFYRSPHKLRLARQGAALLPLPIALASKSIKEAKDGETLYAHAFSYVYRYRESYWGDDEPGDAPPPPGFQPVGAVSISLPQVINSVDATVPAVARQLTAADLTTMKQVAAFGNHATQGYLNQQLGDQLYVPKAQATQQQSETGTRLSALAQQLARLQPIRARATYVAPTVPPTNA